MLSKFTPTATNVERGAPHLRDPRSGSTQGSLPPTGSTNPSGVRIFFFLHFRGGNLASSDALVKGLLSASFIFCCSMTRRRTDPVEGKNSSLNLFISASRMSKLCYIEAHHSTHNTQHHPHTSTNHNHTHTPPPTTRTHQHSNTPQHHTSFHTPPIRQSTEAF